MIAAAVTSLTLAEPLPRRLSALSGPQNFTLERVGGVNYGEELYRVASLTPAAPASPLFTTCDPPLTTPRGRALSETVPLPPANATGGLRAAEPVLWAWLVAWLTLLGVGLLGAAALLWAGRDAPPASPHAAVRDAAGPTGTAGRADTAGAAGAAAVGRG